MAAEPYRWMATWYDAVFEPVLSHAKRMGVQLRPPKPGELVLDVGCGTGAPLGLYRGLGCRLAGIDPSPANREFLAGGGVRRVELLCRTRSRIRLT
ncbi:MAG: methyltransferase domain-containing protein [Vicinamibacterales bacterium]|nr:methyltransferase domain-containing protein [Vicinamibacterales bacterium]